MAKIIPHISNASGSFDQSMLTRINEAINKAESYALTKLGAKNDVDLVVSDAFVGDIIPETHIGGHTYSSNFVTVTIGGNSKSIKTSDLFLTMCHELCHAVRWQYNDEWASILLDAMFFEGVATAFEIESANANDMPLDYFAETMSNRSDKENEELLGNLKKQLGDRTYDYSKIFFAGDVDLKLPRWSGYSLGYYLVKQYLKKNKKSANEVYAIKYSDFQKFVKLNWG